MGKASRRKKVINIAEYRKNPCLDDIIVFSKSSYKFAIEKINENYMIKAIFNELKNNDVLLIGFIPETNEIITAGHLPHEEILESAITNKEFSTMMIKLILQYRIKHNNCKIVVFCAKSFFMVYPFDNKLNYLEN